MLESLSWLKVCKINFVTCFDVVLLLNFIFFIRLFVSSVFIVVGLGIRLSEFFNRNRIKVLERFFDFGLREFLFVIDIIFMDDFLRIIY